jgi:hypothetical protein
VKNSLELNLQSTKILGKLFTDPQPVQLRAVTESVNFPIVVDFHKLGESSEVHSSVYESTFYRFLFYFLQEHSGYFTGPTGPRIREMHGPDLNSTSRLEQHLSNASPYQHRWCNQSTFQKMHDSKENMNSQGS